VRRASLNADDFEPLHDRAGYCRAAIPLGRRLGAEGIGGTVYRLGEGERICPYHFHHGVEEWLLVVDGAPVVRTPAGERALRAGDVVCFPSGPGGAHAVSGPGIVLMLSETRLPYVSVYPDSDKLGTRPGPGHDEDRLEFRRGDAVGYWDGE